MNAHTELTLRKWHLMLAVGTCTGLAMGGPLNFEEVTATRVQETVNEPTSEKHVDFGDFDKDGDMDVVVGLALSDFGQRTNELYRNDDGVFQEVSGSPVIPGFDSTDTSRVAHLVDLNADGWLDIHVVNDSNSGFGPGNDKVYINRHPGGVFSHFEDQSVARLPSNGMLGASCAGVVEDLDHDGDPDLYMGNYPNDSADRLLFNDGTGNFQDVSGGRIAILGTYVVDVSTGDVNGDGLTDLLVTNDGFQGAYIQYNNINGQGTGDGDFAYPGSTTNLGSVTVENALEPGDFDNDGDLDIYWSSRVGTTDVILENTGNDANDKAVFQQLNGVLPPSVTGIASRKATVADLNDDGRDDVFVMKETNGDGRPTVLRNTSVNGSISFVDWTPATAFPTGSNHEGWHAAAFNADDDPDLEIFLGSFSGNHLFDRVEPATFDEGDLTNGVVPGVFNGPATLVNGEASSGQSDEFTIEGVSGFVSAIVSGDGDYLLEVIDGGNSRLSNRGGLGVEEALQFDGVSGDVTIRVTVLDAPGSPADLTGPGGDGVPDGNLTADDFFFYLGLFAGGDPAADLTGPGGDGVPDGNLTADDFFFYLDLFSQGPGGDGSYDLEILSRS